MYTSDTGRILTIDGPHFADGKNNDAACLKVAMEQREGLRTWAKKGTIFIVDRGYRDVIKMLTDMKYTVYMPSVIGKGQKQHSTVEANASRLVTKIRWVVEARNGHIKSIFKFFRDIIPMQHVTHIGDFFRIACAVINAYGKPIRMAHATPEMAKKLIEQSEMPNVLQAFVEEEHLIRKRKGWVELTSQFLPEFPKLTQEYLHDLTMGVYQLKLARSYTQDKIQEENEYGFKILLEQPGLIRVKIKSRFSGSKFRNVWVSYIESGIENGENQDDEDDPINGWYCDCPNGARTLGCCAHVAGVLWYMGKARHQDKNQFPSNDLLSVIHDCSNRPLPNVNPNTLNQPQLHEPPIEELFVDVSAEDLEESFDIDVDEGEVDCCDTAFHEPFDI